MRKLENSDVYKNILKKIKEGDENAKKELASFTFFEFRANFVDLLKKLKIELEDEDVDGFIYPLLYDYIEKSSGCENYSMYKAVTLKAVETRLINYKKQTKNKKEILFDHTAEVDKNIVVNEGIVDPDEQILKQEFNDIFRHLIIEYLRPQEQTILIQYFGLDGQGTTTMAELGRKYNLTRERIRQVIARGLRNIREKLKIKKDRKNIKDYADDFRV